MTKNKQYIWRLKNPQRYMWLNAKHRAKNKNIHFDIQPENIKIPDYCPALNIKLKISEGIRRTDNSPSLDRIDITKGYTKDNIVVVSHKANCIKYNTKHPNEIQQVADFYKSIYHPSPSLSNSLKPHSSKSSS